MQSRTRERRTIGPAFHREEPKTSGADQRLSWSLVTTAHESSHRSSSGLFMNCSTDMPRLSWSCRTVCRSSPTPRQNDNSWSDTRGGSRMPELGPYGSVRGALSIRPPKHAASDNHRRSTTRRSSLSSSETPGVSAKRRASAARRWHSSIKWLLCSTVTSASLFFACSMISSPASARRRAPCLTAAPLKRRPRGLGSVTKSRAP